jgi:serine phosphatase RsbU (regulator of sigma subunit)
MNSVFDREKLLPAIVHLCLPVVDADAVWLELESGRTFVWAASEGIGAEELARMPGGVQQALREAVLAQEEPLLINDLLRDRRTRDIRDWARRSGSLLASRLHFRGHPIGILYALKDTPFGFAEESGGLFQAFADQAAISLENARLVRLSIEQERYREELRLAHDAQMRLLPQAMPHLPGMELHGFCLTANDIGGDFYDAFCPGPDRLDILVGDVSGNGASAAFTMAELHGSLQVLAYRFQSPKDILMEINSYLRRNRTPDNFVTLVYAMVRPSTRQVRFVRAGHPPVGRLRGKRIVWMEPKGVGLGMMPTEELRHTLVEKQIVLEKGDALFFFTDGLVEVRDPDGNEFHEGMLAETLAGLHAESAQGILQGVLDRIERFTRGQTRRDDMTAVVLRVSGDGKTQKQTKHRSSS